MMTFGVEKKNDDKSERQNAERHISGQQKYMLKKKMYDIFGNKK